jgi:hypothetical protein
VATDQSKKFQELQWNHLETQQNRFPIHEGIVTSIEPVYPPPQDPEGKNLTPEERDTVLCKLGLDKAAFSGETICRIRYSSEVIFKKYELDKVE